MEGITRKRRCQIQCKDHILCIQGCKAVGSRFDIRLLFCPKYQRDPIPPQFTFPEYNNDNKYYTSAFILGVDRKVIIKNGQQQMMDHQKQIRDSLEKHNQLIFPRPNSKHTFCSVCKEHYKNYYIHISSQEHRFKISQNSYNVHILDLCNRYVELWEGAEIRADEQAQKRASEEETRRQMMRQMNFPQDQEEEQSLLDCQRGDDPNMINGGYDDDEIIEPRDTVKPSQKRHRKELPRSLFIDQDTLTLPIKHYKRNGPQGRRNYTNYPKKKFIGNNYSSHPSRAQREKDQRKYQKQRDKLKNERQGAENKIFVALAHKQGDIFEIMKLTSRGVPHSEFICKKQVNVPQKLKKNNERMFEIIDKNQKLQLQKKNSQNLIITIYKQQKKQQPKEKISQKIQKYQKHEKHQQIQKIQKMEKHQRIDKDRIKKFPSINGRYDLQHQNKGNSHSHLGLLSPPSIPFQPRHCEQHKNIPEQNDCLKSDNAKQMADYHRLAHQYYYRNAPDMNKVHPETYKTSKDRNNSEYYKNHEAYKDKPQSYKNLPQSYKNMPQSYKNVNPNYYYSPYMNPVYESNHGKGKKGYQNHPNQKQKGKPGQKNYDYSGMPYPWNYPYYIPSMQQPPLTNSQQQPSASLPEPSINGPNKYIPGSSKINPYVGASININFPMYMCPPQGIPYSIPPSRYSYPSPILNNYAGYPYPYMNNNQQIGTVNRQGQFSKAPQPPQPGQAQPLPNSISPSHHMPQGQQPNYPPHYHHQYPPIHYKQHQPHQSHHPQAPPSPIK